MSHRAHRTVYRQLKQRLIEAPDHELQQLIQAEMDELAPKIDQMIMVPSHRCEVCGGQLISTMRKPWWWCLENPDEHWKLKSSFDPDPPLTEPEWQEVGEHLATAAGFVLTSILCGKCRQPVTYRGQVLHGYCRHFGANNYYCFPALIYHLGIDQSDHAYNRMQLNRYQGANAFPVYCEACQ